MTLPMRLNAASPSLFGLLVAIGFVGGMLLSLSGCREGVKVSTLGQPVEAGGVTLNVTDYQIRRLTLIEGSRTYEYDEPVLAIEFELTNEGKESFMYSPTHGSKQMTESTSPLLYPAPDDDKSLPPASKTPIKGVFLEKGNLDRQVTQPTSIEPGQTLRDVILYEVPKDKKTELIFSLPPTMHRGTRPVLFRIPYEYKKPSGPETYSVGDVATFDGVTFTVESAEHAYVETKHPTEGKGYSADPLFRIKYKITNNNEEPVTYTPGHSAVSGQRTEALYANGRPVSRVTFGSSDEVPGWVTKQQTIEPSSSLTDFSLFESPGRTIDSLQFEYPASRFERGGLVRVNISYEYQTPDKPKSLKKDDTDESDE